jgi:hypothetical protein
MTTIEDINPKRELAAQAIRLCDTMYSTSEQLYKDFPTADYTVLHEIYREKMDTIKANLVENQLSTPEINEMLLEILSNVKVPDRDTYLKNMNRLSKLLFKQTD